MICIFCESLGDGFKKSNITYNNTCKNNMENDMVEG